MQPQQSWRSRHKVLAPVLFFGGGLVLLIIVLGVVAALQGNSTGSCTSNSCVASEIQRSLVGIVAKDEAVITKASCDASTVTQNAGGTYTATCTVTESDGSVSTGDGNLIPSQGEVTYNPQDVITPGS